ncbi:Arb2 domain-containing protein [Lasiosphaeris hirsuta]|uniref:Arb2 domain-containing protein n=1 Tax=Lasiosphaeris hirsuta TaxID=260670 RepID=A0AA40B9A2_9PEZI|nr:Arb2 domain-containing protein [Lasiosphaeris hirsuta]
MFRRRWSGLPADPVYPTDLSELGYFVNEDDEIRSTEDPDCYFGFHANKNMRWNERRRFSMNEAIGKIISSRFDAEGFERVLLPFGTTDPNQPHVQIRVSPDLDKKSRVIVIFNDSSQEFGVIAFGVIDGRGGVNKGSMIDLVRALKKQKSSASDSSPPGIVIANMGELWWWPEGHRALTPTGRHNIPMNSAVHYGRYHDEAKNGIPENRTTLEHARHIFEKVLPAMMGKDAKLDVIAAGNASDNVEAYLNDDKVWAEVGDKMNSMAILGGFYDPAHFKCEGFKTFMKERVRAYVIRPEPLDTPIAGPSDNPMDKSSTALGCPAYSAGEECRIVEMLLIDTQPSLLEWMQRVALEGESYKNPVFEVIGDPHSVIDSDKWEEADAAWKVNKSLIVSPGTGYGAETATAEVNGAEKGGSDVGERQNGQAAKGDIGSPDGKALEKDHRAVAVGKENQQMALANGVEKDGITSEDETGENQVR